MHLNAYQTLDNFYPGEENLEAYKSLQRYMDRPEGDSVYLLGPSSCGKTHLLHGLVHKIQSSTDLEVQMLTSEGLKNSLMTAIRDGTTNRFWSTLQNVNVLILDDCQFLSYGIDDIIVQLSEIYQRKNKRLILGGDYLLDSIRVIPNLKVLSLVRPGYDTKKRILQECLIEKGLALNEDLINLIAEKLDDPRRIRGIASWFCANQDYL